MRAVQCVRVVVDCGGTSSKAALLVDGLDPMRFDSPVTLSGYLEPTRITEVMCAILAPIEHRYADVGLAGVPVVIVIAAAGFVDSVRHQYHRAVEEVIAATFGGAVRSVAVMNDAVGLLLGHRADGVVVAGTGSSVIVRASDGTVVQFGGHDWVAADEGSAFWIGLDGIRQVARDVDDDRRDSPLRRAFTQTYGVDDAGAIGGFRDLAVAGPRMKAEIARFAVGVCGAAAQGDARARKIVETQADALAATVERAIRRASWAVDRDVTIVDCGGMTIDSLYRAAFRAAVEDRTGGLVRRIRWQTVVDGLDAVAEIAGGDLQWPESLGARRPLVVGAGSTGVG